MDRSHAACAKTWAPSAWFWMEASGSGGRIGKLSGHSTRQRLARLDWSCTSSREDASAFWSALVAYEMCADGAHCSTQCRSAREGIVARIPGCASRFGTRGPLCPMQEPGILLDSTRGVIGGYSRFARHYLDSSRLCC